MSLETSTYINGLVSTNPLGSDPLADADGHLRLLKATIKATFPNITGPVTATQAQLNAPFPVGGIILWSGSLATVPTGWLLCNGVSGTPDLRDRFVVGAGSTYAVGVTGGAATVALSIAELPSHNHGGVTSGQSDSHIHTGLTDTVGNHSHAYNIPLFGNGNDETQSYPSASDNFNPGRTYSSSTDAAGSHYHNLTTAAASGDHTHTIQSQGSGTAHENRPPYYALAYIMKI